jgi:hypothetical protein
MGSHAQDPATQAAASTAAQANNAVLTANAQQNQTFSNNARTSLFGTYNPATGTYSGGSESAFLNPNSINQSTLNGTFLNQYNNESNALANNTQNAVGTTMQNLASRGLGKTPSGFAADQERQAYQTQATTQGNDYAAALQGQNAQAVGLYDKATSDLANSGTGAQSAALTGQGTVAGNNASLYGTASQQVQSPWATALSGVAGLAGGAGSILTGINGKPCWIAAELYGGWFEPRTVLIREWLCLEFAKSWIGDKILKLYVKYGERIAARIKVSPALRSIFTPIFNLALKHARAWKAAK